MPQAYLSKFIFPEEYNIPFELQYDFMIHRIAGFYGLSITDARRHTERDFWMMAGFENLESAREEYFREIMNSNKNY